MRRSASRSAAPVAWRSGFYLAQAGEFSLVLLTIAFAVNLVVTLAEQREEAAEQFRQVVAAEADVSRDEEALLHGVFSLADTAATGVAPSSCSTANSAMRA